MSHKRKKSIIVLGNGKSLKEAVITNILGKDLSKLQSKPGQFNTEIYEYGDLEITCGPDLNEAQNLKELFAVNQHPDLCLLVVEEDFRTPDVWEQIEDLSRTTGKTTEEFIVVPFGFNHHYTMQLSTLEQHFRKLINVDQIQPNKRSAGRPDPNSSTASLSLISQSRRSTGTRVNLVLLGLTGEGKSSSGNTIVGEKRFMSRASSKQTTTECQAAETEIRGRRVRVIDTPNIFDDELDQSVKNRHVTKCRELCESEPCVYLLVMSVSRFTHGERNILKKLEEAFGTRSRHQTIILFSRGDDLKYDGITTEQFMNNCQKELKKIVDDCGRRCVVFNNKDKNPHQVEKLMETVEKMFMGHYKY